MSDAEQSLLRAIVSVGGGMIGGVIGLVIWYGARWLLSLLPCRHKNLFINEVGQSKRCFDCDYFERLP